MSLRIFLCDDASAFLTLVRYWVDGTEDLEIVGIASTVEALVEEAPATRPDVIVLDHLLGASNSSEVAPRVRDAVPGAPILLLSGIPGSALAEAAKACGAEAYLGKSADAGEFCDAVRAAAQKAPAASERWDEAEQRPAVLAPDLCHERLVRRP